MDTLAYIAPFVLGSVAVGIMVGYFLRSRTASAHPLAQAAEQERQATLKVLLELLRSAEQMSGDVESHNTELRATARHVGDLQVSGEMDVIRKALLGQMASIISSNRRLQSDLVCSRYRMEEQAEQIDHARREARTDPLTAVGNRKSFDERLPVLLARWEREREPFVLVMMDLDHFKRINDAHGHPAGDHVLGTLAGWLKEWIADRGLVARYGGDEFAVLLPRTALSAGVEQAEAIRRNAAERASGVNFGGEQIAISFSIGVAAAREGDSEQSILQRADEALFRAKQAGRNQVRSQPADDRPAPSAHVAALFLPMPAATDAPLSGAMG